jgi:hypothetical protein
LKENKDSTRLADEYNLIVKDTIKLSLSESELDQQPIFEEDMLAEKMPGNLRRPEYLLSVLRKLIVYFKSLLTSKEVQVLSPLVLVGQLHERFFVE